MPKPAETALRAVLFTDVVGSTELAREMGDVRWSRLLAAQRRVVRAELKRHHGREVDTAGDGFFAVFDRPADAVRCGFAACRGVQDLGLDIRAGVHFGEVEMTGGGVHGIVVHTGARVMGQAEAAEVLITATVKDLVAGARLETSERGTTELKGVPGTWALFDVMAVDDELRSEPIEGASVASERRARASATPAAGGRPRWLAPAAAAAAVLAAAVIWFAARPAPTFVPAAGTVARIEDGRFDEPVRLASFPTGMTVGEGRIWVTDQRGQIYWLDPSSGESGSRGSDGVPTGIASGGGAVWLTNGFGVSGGPLGGVSRLAPATLALTPAFDTPVGSEAIAWGADQLWVADTDTGTISVFDTVTGQADQIELPESGGRTPEPVTITFDPSGSGALWIGDGGEGRVYRLDPFDTGRIQAFPVDGVVSAIAVGADGVWVAHALDDTLTLLDRSTGAVRTTVDAGAMGCNEPVSIAVTTDGVWVACALSGKVIRIDPGTLRAEGSLAVDGAPAVLTTDGAGAVWVAVRPS